MNANQYRIYNLDIIYTLDILTLDNNNNNI